jgi:hypothetical protein
MDELKLETEFEDEVRRVMGEQGIEREDAIYQVALERGQVYGAGDLVCMRRLTPDELRAIGLDHDPEEVFARDLAPLAENGAAAVEDSADGIELSALASRGGRD